MSPAAWCCCRRRQATAAPPPACLGMQKQHTASASDNCSSRGSGATAVVAGVALSAACTSSLEPLPLPCSHLGIPRRGCALRRRRQSHAGRNSPAWDDLGRQQGRLPPELPVYRTQPGETSSSQRTLQWRGAGEARTPPVHVPAAIQTAALALPSLPHPHPARPAEAAAAEHGRCTAQSAVHLLRPHLQLRL